MKQMAILLTAAALALCACDRSSGNVIHKSREAREQASEVVAIDADQKIGMARQLIEAGKTADAERILDQLNQDPSRLPEATQEKLRQALDELEQAKNSR